MPVLTEVTERRRPDREFVIIPLRSAAGRRSWVMSLSQMRQVRSSKRKGRHGYDDSNARRSRNGYPHIPFWLVALAIAIPIGPLVFSITPHVTGGTLATVGVSVKLSAVAAIIIGILAVMVHNSSASQLPSKPTGPASVVESFITAINDHNWPKVWQLGGKNLGIGEYRTYRGMIKGYQCTDRDVLNGNPTARRQVVSGSFLAYESNGTTKAVQRYVFSYVVRGSAIISGEQSLVSGSPPPGC